MIQAISMLTRLLVKSRVALVLAPMFFLSSPLHAQELAHRLILKDGSYQLVNRYEVKGDRVHYYSAERDEWEELPSDLVDWPATNKYEKDRAAGASVPEAAQLDKEIEHERELEEMKLPEVAPGLRLPENSGVFLLDTFQGEPQIDEIQQNAADINNSKTGLFRNPLAGQKQSLALEGAHATVQSHVDVPSLYINVDDQPRDDQPGQDSNSKSNSTASPQQPQQPVQPIVPFDRFHIIRTEVKPDRRILGAMKREASGKISEEPHQGTDQHAVKTTITTVAKGWFKLTPSENLAPGEYALVETGKEGMNLYVWDFGVNPKAPANTTPWKPEAKPSTPAPAAPTKSDPNK
jgi:hypothetical protein